MGGLSSKVIQELAPPFLLNFPGLFCFLLSFIVFIAFPKTKINLADLFMISGLFLMSLVARRSIAYLVFIGIIPLTRLIIDFIGDYKCKLLDEGYRGFMSYKSAKVFVFVFTIIIFGTAIFFNFSRNNLVDEYTYPIKACDYLLENVNTENMRLFNDFNYGSYIEFRGIPAFIDSRSEVYTKEYNDTNILEDTINISFRSKILY